MLNTLCGLAISELLTMVICCFSVRLEKLLKFQRTRNTVIKSRDSEPGGLDSQPQTRSVLPSVKLTTALASTGQEKIERDGARRVWTRAAVFINSVNAYLHCHRADQDQNPLYNMFSIVEIWALKRKMSKRTRRDYSELLPGATSGRLDCDCPFFCLKAQENAFSLLSKFPLASTQPLH